MKNRTAPRASNKTKALTRQILTTIATAPDRKALTESVRYYAGLSVGERRAFLKDVRRRARLERAGAGK